MTARRFVEKRGSFALEAALSVPVLLVTLLFLIAMLLSVEAEMRLKTAVDRTAAEIALLPPIIFSLIDENEMKLPVADLLSGSEISPDSTSAQLRAGVLSIINPDKLEALVNDAALDLTSSILFSSLINARIRYWQDRLGKSSLLSAPSAWLDWNLADDQLYLEVDYEIRTLLGRSERQFTALVPIWRPQQPEAEEKKDSESIWQLDNFSRGQKLRSRFGGNLPASYPVIARFENGEVLAIKSMDLTRPTYSDPRAVFSRVSTQISELAAFAGTAKPFGRDSVWIQATDIQSRRLLLIVPVDSDLTRYGQTFAALTREAAAKGVTFEIVSYEKAKSAAEASPDVSP